MKKVLVIGGLTATGKSSLAIDWAKKLNGEIISVDSVGIYKQLTIASAKPTKKQQKEVKHHGIDLLDVNQPYSIKDFQQYAREKIDEITKKGKLPILVGGSGLYLKAVLYDYHFEDELIRDDEWATAYSNQELHEKLQLLDPMEATKIHMNNRKRLVRAISIMKQQNKPKSQLIQEQKQQLLYDVMMFCAYLDRDKLHQNIDERVNRMVEEGLAFEVEEALKLADWDAISMSAIGVKEWRFYFEKKMSLEETKDVIKTKTKQFSKRQRTWFKHQFECDWLDMNDSHQIELYFSKVKTWINT
jgi:tRNA dimethylallyltransferase